MASFKEVGKGKYKLYVELGYDATGKRKRKTKTIKASGPREAKKILAEFETEMYNKTHVESKDVPFTAFLEIWKSNYGYTEIQRRTLENYENTLDSSILPYFGKMKMKKIKTLHIVEYFNIEKKNGKRTLEMKYHILSNMFRLATKWGMIEENPMLNVDKPKSKYKERNPYNDEEIELLLKRITMQPTEHQLMVKLALIGGLRRAEIAGLSADVIDFANDKIIIKQSLQYTKRDGLFLKSTKTNKSRTVTIPSFLTKELKAYYLKRLKIKMMMADIWEGFKNENGEEVFMIFSNEYGKPYTPNAITRFWQRFLERSDLRRISFHDLRHSSASYSLRHGVNIKVIQKRLGHRDIRTTLNTYSHVTEEDDRTASETFEDFGH